MKKMFIIYLSLVLMKKKTYQRRNIKEEKVWNQEPRMHKLMDVLELKEVNLDTKILN